MTIYMNPETQENYEPEELTTLILYAYGKTFKFYYPIMLDTPDTVVVHHDGEVWIASAGFRPEPEDGWWYMGDEDWKIGDIDPTLLDWKSSLRGLDQVYSTVFEECECKYLMED